MTKVKVVIDLSGSDIQVASSTPNAALIVVILEKAKLKVLDGIHLEEKSPILMPNGNVN